MNSGGYIPKREVSRYISTTIHRPCHFSLRSQNSEYPRIFRVTGANQNAQKLLSTDLVNIVCTNDDYDDDIVDNHNEGIIINIILYIQIENVEQELLTMGLYRNLSQEIKMRTSIFLCFQPSRFHCYLEEEM